MVVDSNILIGYLNGDKAIVEILSTWKRADRLLLISSISFAEVLAYPLLGPQDIQKAKDFLASFISVPFDNKLAEMTASLRRLYSLSLPDAAIIATALTYQVPLITRDKQLRKVKEIMVVEI